MRILALLAIALSATNAFAIEPLVLGFHAHRPQNFSAGAAAGYRAVRFWDTFTTWSDLMPERSKWVLQGILSELAASERAQLKVVWTIGSTPKWASARPDERCAYGRGCAAEPYDIEDWRQYVRTIAATFRGRIECYEPWNEVSFPTDSSVGVKGEGGDPGEFFSGTAAEMVALTQVAYEEIKRIDPNACVLSPSFHSSGDWAKKLEAFLVQGGAKYIDKISFHFYFALEPESIVPEMRMVKRVMARHGISNKPIWNTEVGLSFGQVALEHGLTESAELIYSTMLRAFLINYSEGIERVYWYALDNGNMGFGSDASGSRFAMRALQAVAAELSGALKVRCEPKSSLWSCRVWKQDASTVTIVWQAGVDAPPTRWLVPRNASRWNHEGIEMLRAGEAVSLDWRPVVMKGLE